MSWLVAVCFPALLMLSTHGLQRLESVLDDEHPAAGEIVVRVEQSAPAPPERAVSPSVPSLSVPTMRIEPRLRPLEDEPGLPTRLYAQPRPNQQFQPTGYANRV